MYKELIISVVIIVCIVTGNIITHKYLEKSTEDMKNSLNSLEKSVLKEDKNEIELSMRNLQILWDSLYKKLTYFNEHDELEKVYVRLSSISGNIKAGEYKQTMQYIDECIYILDHIKDKESLYWENIF